MDDLQSIFKLTHSEAVEVRNTIIDAIEMLSENQILPVEFDDHILQREPWRDFHEFHVLSDLLVVYYKIDRKRRIRMVTITNHSELSAGYL
ncbi:type II toxin-antitoxin system mRNA interferase toxin, RelE/StbE family [Lactobacillus sp. ESL0703]|uniref:type II toxin-antitoxin system mRNA interferase toxin, RelE/StbE family n=1 Tax=Lactobacillus sp. ESL0703 TaxID=2983218 RepID=UPI0032AF3AB1